MEQMTIVGEAEHIPGAKRDDAGHLEERWVRLIRTTSGITVEAPPDMIVTQAARSQTVLLRWP